MSKFFINRPIVAIVISILMVIAGVVALLRLPVAQFPNISDPQIQIVANYTGADATTVAQSVATPIEQQMAGVDGMNYMYSQNASNGQMNLTVDFNIDTDTNTDQILSQMRVLQANAQLPSAVLNNGVTVQKSTASPLMLIDLSSTNDAFDNIFLANYAFINLNDELTRVPGVASVSIFGAGQYAMRCWVNPDKLANLGVTVPEIISALRAQNTVNPAGQIGGEPVPPGQQFTYTVRAPGRLPSAEDFGNIIVRADSSGGILRLRDVARIELGAQNYSVIGRYNGKPAALLAVYQAPGSNAVATAAAVRKVMEEAKTRFPSGLEYVVALDTTLAVTSGIKDIQNTILEAMVLVTIVVFLFLQGWRATLIPLLAVPVSLVGTFIIFPLLGFSINTLSLFGLVLAVGLVVDDAIVVVEAVEHHIEGGMTPHDAALRAMEEVSGPVIAIALILAAVFIPTAFIPGITGRLYQQFAVTIAVSVALSAFNALTLSPALAAMLTPSEEGVPRAFGGVLSLVQSCLWPRYRWLCRCLPAPDPQILVSLSLASCAGCRGGLPGQKRSRQLSAGRRPGFHVCRAATAFGVVAAADLGGVEGSGRHLAENARSKIRELSGWLQPVEWREHHLQLLLFRLFQGLGRTQGRRRELCRHQAACCRRSLPRHFWNCLLLPSPCNSRRGYIGRI